MPVFSVIDYLGVVLRELQIVVPASRSASLLRDIQTQPGVLGVRFQPGASIQPPGDVVGVEVVCRNYAALMRWLQERGVGHDPGTSLCSSEPQSLISPGTADLITTGSSESSWEEMEHMVARESHMTPSALMLMGAAGVIAAAGLATGALHLVAASMVIAPGFEPLARIALGVCAGSASWKRGLWSFVTGYAAVIAGAMLGAVLLGATGTKITGEAQAYFDGSQLVRYWTQPTFPGLLVSFCGAVAGALLIASNRSVLTAGVMLALALIPTAALIGVGVVAGDFDLSQRAAFRWIIEAGLVLVTSLGVFGWKRLRTHRRRMMV